MWVWVSKGGLEILNDIAEKAKFITIQIIII